MFRQKVLYATVLASLLSFDFLTPALAQIPPFQQQTQPKPSREQILSSINPGLFNPKGTEPDINAVPALSNVVKGGGKLYYLGERSNLNGWLVVKNGQIQMIYLTPDHQTVIVGGLFTADGQNVTGPQITYLSQTNRDIGAMMDAATQQQTQVTTAGSVEGGVAAVPGSPAAALAASNGQATGPLSGMSAAVTLSPGERLYQDMQAAASVELGPKDKPEVMILVAPKCPNCKGTWKELRDSVKAGKLRVRLIPIYNSMGNEELDYAAQLLKSPTPFETWDRFADGDTSALSGKPDDVAVKAVISNLELVKRWNIKGYPYMVYRGKDGRIKIVQGKPSRIAPILLDLGL